MKKVFFTLALLAVTTLLSAQILQIEHDGHVYENGETVICTYDEANFEYAHHMQIRNISDQELNVVVEQDVLETVPDAMVTFCWGSCYVPTTNPFVGTIEVVIPANTLSPEDFSAHVYIPETEPGVVKIIYHVYDVNESHNRVDIVVLAGQTADTPEYTFNLGQAYPNPATSQVHFDLQSNSNVNVTVYNLLGQEVKSQLVSNHQNRVNIAVDDLQPGIYFCRFSINGEIVRTEKFIVKH